MTTLHDLEHPQASSRPAVNSVLIIEDDLGFGDELLLEFTGAGYEATHFLDAHYVADRKTIDEQLIILDVTLADSDAVDVLQILGKLNYQGMIQILSASPPDVLKGVHRFGHDSGLKMLPTISKPMRPADVRLKTEQHASAPVFDFPPKPDSGEVTGAKPWAIELGLALRKQWVEVWYQPKFDLKTGRMIGAECLSRVNHPSFGIIAPGAFIPNAAQADLRALTELVLRRACADWSDFEGLGHPIKLAINVPGPSLIELPLVRLLRENAPKSEAWCGLVLEVTEEEALCDLEAARKISTQLQIYNVCLSIDDFGVGYSGFARLRDIPFKEIKLDRSLVDRCADDTLRRALCRTVVELAHSFGAIAVAEGVERRSDLDYLRSIDCDVAQGYFCARPMRKEQLLGLMRAGSAAMHDVYAAVA